ncbi:hypothetical protein N8K70_09330 [Microbacterium betulae]|uniref:Uncharacterized protein n=1 Tax=Microbacterium betulae TaxID=2981139 RepID=A0AA97FEU7_9MICO|nr:hypothetical protein [Microbacterium sp. AB]WOF21598.1 hypothetical protein N8K70_09330 [Microbacterium sp. AB]
MSASALFERDVPLDVESETGWIDKYPRKRWQRWLLRLGLALPFVALTIWYHVASGGDWSATPNGELAERVGALDWSVSSVTGITHLYPPITSVTAMLIPGGALGLGLAGSLVAGVLLQLMLKALYRRRIPVATRILLFLAVAATPVFGFIATTNIQAMLGLALFANGMFDLARFVSLANTQAGFRAGVLFAASALADSTGLLAAPAAALAGVLLLQARRKARGANATVVLFPTVAMMGSLMVLGVAFGVGPLVMFGDDVGWQPSLVDAFLASFATLAGWTFLAPAILLSASALLLGFGWAALTSVITTALVLLAYLLGLMPDGASGNGFVMVQIVAIAITPAVGGGWRRGVVTATTLLMLVIGWASAYTRTAVVAWVTVLVGGGAG